MSSSATLSFCARPCGLDFHSTKDSRISTDLFLSCFSLSLPGKKLPITIESGHLWNSSLFNLEERDRKSKTLKPSRLSSETASGHSSMTKAIASIVQPQIRKSWDSMENAIKKKKVVISKFTLTCISLQTI